jgi:predicted SnoaL-like aldol condensation-catalyzing enzyme
VIGPSASSDERERRNKESAIAFYELMFNQCQPAAAVEQYVGDVYIQHNPQAADGKQAFVDYFMQMAAEYPGKHVEFKRAFADGDYVVLHCHQSWPGDRDYAGIDIFRFDDRDKIVEHWDVLQVVPETSRNDNSMF